MRQNRIWLTAIVKNSTIVMVLGFHSKIYQSDLHIFTIRLVHFLHEILLYFLRNKLVKFGVGNNPTSIPRPGTAGTNPMEEIFCFKMYTIGANFSNYKLALEDRTPPPFQLGYIFVGLFWKKWLFGDRVWFSHKSLYIEIRPVSNNNRGS